MSFTTVDVTTNNRQLALVNQHQRTLNWSENPLQVIEGDLAHVDMGAIRTILDERFLTPSQEAGLGEGEIECDVIRRVDAESRQALLDYKNRFAVANAQDAQRIRELKEEGIARRNRYVCRGLPFFLIGGLVGYFIAEHETKKELHTKGSAHRRRWLHAIDTRERQRKDRIKREFAQVGRRYVRNLNRLEGSREVDRRTLRRLGQINRVYQAMFRERLVVDDTPVGPFIQGLQRQLLAAG